MKLVADGVTAPAPTSTGSSLGIWLTFMAAVIAAIVAGTSIYFVRKTGRETAMIARVTAKAAETSARSSRRAARAAKRTAAVNERTALAQGIRAEADARAKLYQESASLLGHEKAAVRLAGVYAIARLADDWPEQRQTCVDVLSAYMRVPADNALSPHELEGDWQIRQTIFGIVEAHVRNPASADSWSSMGFNFRGAQFKPFTFHGGVFEKYVNFDDAVFEGEHQFVGTDFRGGHSNNIDVISP